VPATGAATTFTPVPFESPRWARTLRCCLIGPTNAGKSTLLNALSEANVSEVSERIHMTRENTIGYVTDPTCRSQVEFIDAPGALGPAIPLLRRAIWDAVRRADLALSVVDAGDERSAYQTKHFLKQLTRELELQQADMGRRTETALVLNKVDRVKPKSKLLEMSSMLHKVQSSSASSCGLWSCAPWACTPLRPARRTASTGRA